MVDQLQLYNEALTEHLGERRLASLTENREPRRVLDAIWNSEGFIDDVLEAAAWTCALRSIKMEPDPDVTPEFGQQYAYVKPDDYLQTAAVCSDPYFKEPLVDMQYKDEAGMILADCQPIYFMYVSNDSDYGRDLSKWSPSMVRYAAAYLALRACIRITGDKAKKRELEDKTVPTLLLKAKSRDAFKKPTQFMPMGGWAKSRLAGGVRNSRRYYGR